MEEISQEKIQTGLRTHSLGWRFCFFSSVSSTNALLHEKAKAGEEEGLVVAASRQLQGRGRRGRDWFSSPGGLYLSFLLRPSVALQEWGRITFLMALVLIELLQEDYCLPALMKWPNDIQLHGKKLSGILTELSRDGKGDYYLITGMGVNVNQKREHWPPHLTDRAISLAEALQQELDPNDLLLSFLRNFQEAYHQFLQGQLDPVARHLHYSSTLGQRVHLTSVTGDYQGQALEITPQGSLRVLCMDGIIREFFEGDITVRKMDT